MLVAIRSSISRCRTFTDYRDPPPVEITFARKRSHLQCISFVASPVFADAQFWVAFLNDPDQSHAAAQALAGPCTEWAWSRQKKCSRKCWHFSASAASISADWRRRQCAVFMRLPRASCPNLTAHRDDASGSIRHHLIGLIPERHTKQVLADRRVTMLKRKSAIRRNVQRLLA